MHSRALLCTSIVANSFSTATVAIDAANCSGADVIEIRLDKILDLQPNVHLKPLFESCKLPFIVTYRPKWEGCVLCMCPAAADHTPLSIAEGSVLCYITLSAPRQCQSPTSHFSNPHPHYPHSP